MGSFQAWYFAACRHVCGQRLTAGVLLLLRVCGKGEAVMMSLEVSEKALGTLFPECDRGKNRK